ncbi:similar to Saccharomyces cerevisiae YNR041C COQ2 Para hydroxybenzoate: polyprenyl transferase, catalyzes the second step in ubiquinone (coenzyme Q) biosynthesis [Maudiozyma saulgeensis]|uniref:4-hydroxybenzoate polyprenyltransferase, mitochondrial n=1 Tax=Maudiozyma saulgeensis TaxID=1789683 RepID=A0A1X7R816_9SACH|nr:similar to Saccharomyces cerevisiae YNR041C COQ2 Para hydroxybenzoate: polyprenyl transferase, catalyzes the second step in ubiquinone (coenzyme Q) biosynthesis [Kazachstania saulgeensis]
MLRLCVPSRTLQTVSKGLSNGQFSSKILKYRFVGSQPSTFTKNLIIRWNSTLSGKNELKTTFSEEQLALAREQRLKGLGPFVSKLPERWIPYAELMRLEKPVGTWLLYLPCSWAIVMGAMETSATLGQTAWMLGLFGVGALIMRGAGCTINDIFDRKLDDKVIRSVERPIASKRVSVRNASLFLGAQTAVGMGILAQLPANCWWLGLASLPIVFAYPLFKRFTYYPQAALSACFNWGALLGFPAMGIMDWSTMIPLYVGSYLWCMIYDTIYAHQDKKFDIKAGIKSTALAWGKNTKTVCNVLATSQFAMYALAGINSGLIMGPGFIGGLSIFAYRVFTMIKKVDLDNPDDCWKAFTGNIKTGLYFSYALFFDYLLQLMGFL